MNLIKAAARAIPSFSNRGIDWEEMDKVRREVRGFLQSLNAREIGTGLVLYDKHEFRLKPRSAYINNYTYQWIVTRLSEGASFGATQAAFIMLKEKVEMLRQKIALFNPSSPPECPLEAVILVKKLLEMQTLVENVARPGLAQLCQNYQAGQKFEHASSLMQLGKDSFEVITQFKDILTAKVLPHCPELRDDIALKRNHMAASKLLNRRILSITSLRATTWTSTVGVVIARVLLKDCRKDLKQKAQLTRDNVRNAANLIKLPSQTQPIPAQGGAVQWIPLRPLIGEQITFEEGIIGTCERDGMSAQSLCNIFYRIDRAECLTISCAAINTFEKARQMVAVIQHVQRFMPENKKGRWILHQLNSFLKEETLIFDVHKQMSLMESILNEEAKAPISVLHVNTSFNAASALPSEDPKSLKNINISSLARLIEFVFIDVTSLLEPRFTKKNHEWAESIRECSEAIHLAHCMNTTKQRRAQLLLDPTVAEILNLQIIKCMDLMDDGLPVEDSFSRSDSSGSSSSDDLMAKASESPQQRSPLNGRRPEKSKERSKSDIRHEVAALEKNLLESQDKLEKMLHQLIPVFQRLIVLLESQRTQDYDPKLEKAILVFNTLKLVFSLQYKEQVNFSTNRCTEIELSLFLYRLLNFNVIISCLSGLDRTGSVVAFQDSLSQLEEELYAQFLREIPPQQEERLFIARLKAQKRIYDLIVNINSCRMQLFHSTHTLIKENKVTLQQELPGKATKIPDQEEPFKLREVLLQSINQSYPSRPPVGEAPSNTLFADDLKYVQYYLELVAKHLLGTQVEKTLFSTGVLGLKYHHDVNWIKKKVSANPHPIERLPMFIATDDNQLLQLMQYFPGWWSSSTAITPLAIAIFMRLSQLRGK
jgi:hypothetical protein